MAQTPTFQTLLEELAAKLLEQLRERERYCVQLQAESRVPVYGSDSTEQVTRRTASIADLATAIGSVARAANTKT